MRATVVIPTHDHGPTLRHSVPTALAQTVADIEVFIIGDGAPDDTRAIVRDLQRVDARVRYFDYPKGPRLGEAYRHDVLAEARGAIICYLSDDDLWLPDHIETMEAQLHDADFAHALSVRVEPDGRLLPGNTVDFRMPRIRTLMMSDELGLGGAPLSCMAHTLDMYRRLPRGWHTTPKGVATNVHMTRQFVAQDDCRLANAGHPTLLRFPSFSRRGWSNEERVRELETWSGRLTDPEWRAAFPAQVMEAFVWTGAERWYALQQRDLENRHLRERARRTAARAARAQGRVVHLEAKLQAERQALGRLRQREQERHGWGGMAFAERVAVRVLRLLTRLPGVRRLVRPPTRPVSAPPAD